MVLNRKGLTATAIRRLDVPFPSSWPDSSGGLVRLPCRDIAEDDRGLERIEAGIASGPGDSCDTEDRSPELGR